MMAPKINKRNNRYLARLVTGERAPCAFCQREVDDEVTYGKLYAIGDIQCHYYCCLLSCCLIQKGHEEEGLFGFMYTDILAELERCKKHKCSYCSHNGANIGCCVGACRKQFHLPCGREKNAVSLYYGSYKSFCQQHAPRQKIPEHIMANARLRLKADRMKIKNLKEPDNITKLSSEDHDDGDGMVCCICYEAVEGYPSVHTFWPPCCARDAWFHRTCLQRMALSAGMHYLKCPLCNDKKNFYEAVVSQGYYVPDRDAAWELEQNAFAEMYERTATCAAARCTCPHGREHDADNGKWDIKLCLLCGSTGAHAYCLDQSQSATDDKPSPDQSEIGTDDATSLDQSPSKAIRYVCLSCQPAAPDDLNALAKSIEAIIQAEQSACAHTTRPRMRMPSHMSLRRTKGTDRNQLHKPSSSRSHSNRTEEVLAASPNVQSSRLELNLKSPRKPTSYNETHVLRDFRSTLLSPVKLLEQSFKEKVVKTGVQDAVLDESVIEALRRKFRKPRPLCEKKRIVNDILDGLFDNLMTNSPKQKEQLKEWRSPKKVYEAIDIELPKTETSDASRVVQDVGNKRDLKLTTPTKKTNAKYEEIPENTESLKSTGVFGTSDKGIVETPTRNEKDNCEITKNVVPKNILVGDDDDDDDGDDEVVPLKNTNSSVANEVNKLNMRKVKRSNKRSSKGKRKNVKNKTRKLYGAAKMSKERALIKKNKNKEKKLLEISNSNTETPKELDSNMNQEPKGGNEILKRLLTQKTLSKEILLNLYIDSKDVAQQFTDVKNDDVNPQIVDATNNSDTSNAMETSKCKTIDIQQDSSLEISENDHTINIDVIKVDESPTRDGECDKMKIKLPDKPKTCAFKFSPYDKETLLKLQTNDAGIDLENFKKVYLNEVDREFKCSFQHKHVDNASDESKLRTAIDFAMEAVMKKELRTGRSPEKRKRKLSERNLHLVFDDSVVKKRKTSESSLNLSYIDSLPENCNAIVKESVDGEAKKNAGTDRRKKIKTRKDKRRIRKKRARNDKKNIHLTIDSSEKRGGNKQIKNKIKTKFAIRNKDIHVRIKLKNKELSFNIESKKLARKKKKEHRSKFKQYILQFPEGSSKEVLVRPENEVCPLKKKHVKQEKMHDHLKQTSIQSFFKLKSPDTNHINTKQ